MDVAPIKQILAIYYRYLHLTSSAMILAVFVNCVAFSPSHASRLQFSEPKRILLPDGRSGELRVLGAESGAAPEWYRIVVFDGEQRLLAISERTGLLWLACDGNEPNCFGFNGLNVFVPDSSTFRVVGVASKEQSLDEDVLLALVAKENWGFSIRKPSLAQTRLIRGHDRMSVEEVRSVWGKYPFMDAARIELEVLIAQPKYYAALAGIGAAIAACFVRLKPSEKPATLDLFAVISSISLRFPLVVFLFVLKEQASAELPMVGPLIALGTGGSLFLWLGWFLRRRWRLATP